MSQLLKQAVSILRFMAFVILQTFRGVIVGPCRFLSPFMVFGSIGAIFIAEESVHTHIAIFGLFVGVGVGMLGYGYDRLLLALQPKGTDIILLN